MILGTFPPETISRLLRRRSRTVSHGHGSVAGSGCPDPCPAIIAFPLAGSLLRSGATTMTVAAFITTLVMGGFVTAPLEMNGEKIHPVAKRA